MPILGPYLPAFGLDITQFFNGVNSTIFIRSQMGVYLFFSLYILLTH